MIRPMAKPVLAVGLLATMVGVWYWALQPPAPTVPSRAVGPPAVRARPLVAVPTVHLPDLAVAPASRRAPGVARNPFARGVSVAQSDQAQRRAGVKAPDAAPRPAPGPPVPVWPRLDLIGVAEAREGDGLVRTAIVSGPHGVHHVRSGDVVEQVYRIERVGGDGVDVRLLPEDRTLRLALRP
jgi:Tfp pilus assembly protein PilP